VFNLAWHPDGTSLASASGDGTARVWRADGSPLHTLQGHSESVTTLAWRRDGQILATGSDDADIRLWNADGSLAATLSGHRSVVRELAWSADGETLASASIDGTVRLWQYDGAALAVVNGHTDRVHAVAWSPQGQTLASSSEDKTVRIWDDGSGGNQPPVVIIPGADPDSSIGLDGSLAAYAEPVGLFTISVPASWSMAERTVEAGLIEYAWRSPDQPGHGEVFVLISNGTTQQDARALIEQVVTDRYITPYGAVPKKQLDLGADSQYRALIYAVNGIAMQADVTAQRVGPYLVIMGIHGPEEQMKAAKERVGDIMGSLQVDPAAKAPEIGIK
jgi:WD40 repeat protein